MVAKDSEEDFVNCYNFILLGYRSTGSQVPKSKKIIFKVTYKTSRSRSWSRKLDLRLRRAGTERNIFGSTNTADDQQTTVH
jgi:hypothetical protein